MEVWRRDCHVLKPGAVLIIDAEHCSNIGLVQLKLQPPLLASPLGLLGQYLPSKATFLSKIRIGPFLRQFWQPERGREEFSSGSSAPAKALMGDSLKNVTGT